MAFATPVGSHPYPPLEHQHGDSGDDAPSHLHTPQGDHNPLATNAVEHDTVPAPCKNIHTAIVADGASDASNNPATSAEKIDPTPEPNRWYTPIVTAFRTIIPYGGVVSNIFSLCSVTLGGGIIGMADSFMTSGIGMSIIYLVVVCILTIYSIAIMGIMIRKTGARNFEEAGQLLFGRWGGHFVGFVMAISCVGTAISYISTAGSLMSPILLKSPGTPEFLKTDNGNHVIVILIWAVLLVPIIIPKNLNSIRYVSTIGVTMVLYFVMTIVIHSCTNGLKNKSHDDVIYFATGNQAIYGLSIFVFSFMNQGPVFSIAMEMRPRFSVKQLTIAAAVACTACTIFYIMAGLFGYLDFGKDVESSILYNFDPVHQPYMMISYIGMLVKICAAFAVNMIPIRNYLYYILHWDLETSPYWKHTLLVVTASVVVLVGGLYIPSVNLAFGLVGSLCGGFIGFIFPALFWMYCGNWTLKKVGIWNYLACYVLLVVGVIAIVFGSIATIYFM